MSRLLYLLLMALFTCGCSTIADATGKMSSCSIWPPAKEDEPEQPDKILASWTDTVLTRADRKPIRGFGGRLMFFAGQSETPIKVDGTLVVYAFDEMERDPNNVRPDRKYVILPQQLSEHYSKSKIGHSYSVWIPWDEVGGVQKDITLLVRFEPKQGAIVMGQQCRQALPGVLPQQRSSSIVALPAVSPQNTGQVSNLSYNGAQQASYLAPLQPENQPNQNKTGLQQQMTTTTIPVPHGMAARWPQAVPPAGQPAEAWRQYGNYSPPQPWGGRREEQQTTPTANARKSSASNCWTANQFQFGSPHDRLRPLGKPLERLNRDRVPSPQHPAKSPSGPGTQFDTERANAAPEG